jgi:hypothetical protein
LKTQSNKLSGFLLKMALLVSLAVTADQGIGKILRHYYYTQLSDDGYRTTFAIDSTKAEILVFGSSRANHHYVPRVFEDSLGMSFYNTGRDGSYFLNSYATMKGLLARYTPKIILLEMNPDELFYDAESYDRLSSLLPYYKDHPAMQSTIELKSRFEKYKLLSGVYPFNSDILTILINNSRYNIKRKPDMEGFIQLNNCMQDTVLRNLKAVQCIPDTVKINRLKDIAVLCKKKKILLFIIQSPVYAMVPQDKSVSLMDSIAGETNTPFWNFAQDPACLHHPAWFDDFDHLNKDGALYFSGLVANQIKGH